MQRPCSGRHHHRRALKAACHHRERFAVLLTFGCAIFFQRNPVPLPSHANFSSGFSIRLLRLSTSRRRVWSLDCRLNGSSMGAGQPAS